MVNHLNPRPVVYDFCKHYFIHCGGTSPSVVVANSCEVMEIIFFQSVVQKNRNDGISIISFPSGFKKVFFHSVMYCVILVQPKQDGSPRWQLPVIT